MTYSFFEVNIDSGNKDHIVLNTDQAAKLKLSAGDRVELINTKNNETLKNVIVDLNNHKKKNSIGIFANTIKRLGLKKMQKVEIENMGKPLSTFYIKKKLDGKKLNQKEINEIIKDVVEGNLQATELAYFVAGGYVHGFSFQETADLTKAMVANGNQIKFRPNQIVVDKHCIGGVPGNRTTMVMVPIVILLIC